MSYIIEAHIEVQKGNTWMHFGAPLVGYQWRIMDELPNLGRLTPYTGTEGTDVTNICYATNTEDFTRLRDAYILTQEDLHNLQKRWNNSECPLDLEDNVLNTYINGDAIVCHRGFDNVRLILWTHN